jgi:hypothetical protein
MAWVKQIPAWVWLLLAAWQLPRGVVGMLAVTMILSVAQRRLNFFW